MKLPFHIVFMEWMLDIQIGRRNLTPIQRIAIAEKYRPILEKIAKERQVKAGIEYGNGGTKLTLKIGEACIESNRHENETNSKLAKMAGVGTETYRRAKRVLDSDNENLKQRVMSGETSIGAGYKELQEVGRGVKLKTLIAANFGRTKNNEAKQRKAINEYVELCGYKNGEHGKKLVQNGRASQEDIANQLGISVSSLKRALSIERNLTDYCKGGDKTPIPYRKLEKR